MTLSELRAQFEEVTGRVDISTTIVDLYINDGQKLLDKLLGISVSNPSIPLTVDADTSWWSENYPLILIQGACYYLEMDYRNTEGMRDRLAAIGSVVTQIDHDNAEIDAEGIIRMEG